MNGNALLPTRGISLSGGATLCRITPTYSLVRLGPSDTDQEEKISVSYESDLNILHIHERIMERFSRRNQELPQLEQELLDLQTQLLQATGLKTSTFRSMQARQEYLERRVNDLRSQKELQGYIEHSKPLLQRYAAIGPELRFQTFGTSEIKAAPKQANPERLQLVQRYLDLAGYYVPLDITRRVPQHDFCSSCGQSFDSLPANLYGKKICEPCGVERNASPDIRETSYSNDDYVPHENFIDAQDRLECKQLDGPGQDFYARLDAFFISIGLASGEEISRRRLLPDGTREGTNREMLIQGISRVDPTQYKNQHLIAHSYWGYARFDISMVRIQINEDFHKTQPIFNEIKQGKASMNVWYRLCRHLQSRDFPCRVSDFKIVETSDIVDDYEMYWRTMCHRAGIPYKPLT